MDIPKTLLLTPTRPGQGSVAELFLRDFCMMFPQDQLVCFAATGGGYEFGMRSPELDWLPMTVGELPNEWAGENQVLYSKAGRLKSHLKLRRIKIECDRLANRVAEYVRTHDVESIIACVAGPATIYLAKAVAEKTKLPIIPIIWDPVDYVATNRGFHKSIVDTLMKDFAALMRMSERCGVASFGMKDHIEATYGLKSSVMISPVTLQEPPASERDDIRIVFAGSQYAKIELQCLIHALNHLQWNVKGRKISLWLLGHYFDIPLHTGGQKADIRFLGFWADADVKQLLSQADIGYVPYWFDTKFTPCVKQCFPNKVSLYMSTGLRVLFHGPADSTVNHFMQRFPVGVSCNTLDVGLIAQAIERVAIDPDVMAIAKDARLRAVEEELGVLPARRRFAELIGVDEKELADPRNVYPTENFAVV